MPKISVMIHTASPDTLLLQHGIRSYFYAVIDSLARQTFHDFELVYIDTNYEENRDRFAELRPPFCVKHVPVQPSHRYWYDRGNTYIAAAKNTGILHASGELLITFDDAELFPSDLLQVYWEHYQADRLVHALHKRMRSIKVSADGDVRYPIDGDIYVNDKRWQHLGARGFLAHQHGSWTYAGTSFPLWAALKLNGFNERMDACKSLEDCDFGNRLTMLGLHLAIDPRAYVYIVEHKSYKEFGKQIEDFIAVENYGMYCAARELNLVRANGGLPSPECMRIIQRETQHYRGFDPLAPENAEKLAVWLAMPSYDLRRERAEIRGLDVAPEEPDMARKVNLQNLEARVLDELPKIQGWCSPEKALRLVRLILDRRPQLCVEIGVFGGSSLIPQAMALKHLGVGRLVGIDPWSLDAALEGMLRPENRDWWSRIDLDDVQRGCQAHLDRLGLTNFCQLHKAKAEEAVGKFDDGSIDLLHIDGNHSEEVAYRDATLYLPKMRRAGLILFDDIFWSEENGKVSTRKAVNYLLEHCNQLEVVKDCMVLEVRSGC